MKVLHVIAGIAPRYGGPTQAILQMCRSLNEQGVETSIATTDADGNGRLNVAHGEFGDYEGVSVIFFRRMFHEGFKFSYDLARWLKLNVKLFDLVHIDGIFSHSTFAAADACIDQEIPYVIRPLGSLSRYGLNRKRFIKNVLLRTWIEKYLANSAAVHFTTYQERENAKSISASAPGVVIPLGVEDKLIEAESHEDSREFRNFCGNLIGDSKFILILCRLHPVKRLEAFIDVFQKLQSESAEFIQWKLVIAGDSSSTYAKTLKQLVGTDKVGRTIIFLDWLEGRLKTGSLRSASLVALPSYQENFGLAAAEALACETPVIVSRGVALAREIEQSKCGWVFEFEPDSLYSCLKSALSDENERKKRGVAGRRLVKEKYTWTAVSKSLISLYESVLNKSHDHERINNSEIL